MLWHNADIRSPIITRKKLIFLYMPPRHPCSRLISHLIPQRSWRRRSVSSSRRNNGHPPIYNSSPEIIQFCKIYRLPDMRKAAKVSIAAMIQPISVNQSGGAHVFLTATRASNLTSADVIPSSVVAAGALDHSLRSLWHLLVFSAVFLCACEDHTIAFLLPIRNLLSISFPETPICDQRIQILTILRY